MPLSAQRRFELTIGHLELPMRIYGDNLRLTRNQWEQMLEDMIPTCENARRIRRNLDQHKAAVAASGDF